MLNAYCNGRFVYSITVLTLPLGSGSAAQQPSYPCEAYAEQAQRKLPRHLQATVMGCAALVRGSLLATLLDLQSADLAKTCPLLTCCRSSHDNVRRCHDWTMICRDAKRGEQASKSRVKAAGSVSVLGRMPSYVLHASR